MDPASIIGIVLALGSIVGATIMDGGDITAIILIPPIILVFGGTIGAAVAGGVMEDAKRLPQSFVRALTAKLPNSGGGVGIIVNLADRARREGLLALESDVAAVEDPFLRRALEMAVDGTDADEVADILGSEVDAKRAADAAAAKLLHAMGGYAPTIGIIGTVLGLVHVLGNLDDPSTLGTKIASAFVATLWGVLSANVIWFPIANRIKRLSEVECEQMELVIEGVLAIQAGNSPRVIERKLTAMMSLAEPVQKDAA